MDFKVIVKWDELLVDFTIDHQLFLRFFFVVKMIAVSSFNTSRVKECKCE